MTETLQVVVADVSIKEITKDLKGIQEWLGEAGQQMSDMEGTNALMEKGIEKWRGKTWATMWM